MSERYPNMEIHEINNFVDDQTCDQLYDWLVRREQFDRELVPGATARSTFGSRTVPFPSIEDDNIKRLVNRFRFDVTAEARKLFKAQLYPDYTDLVYWPNGFNMGVHADACWEDGSPNYVFYRYSAGVTYLNDNYDGGETYFPNFDYVVKPEKGKVVLFLADLEHQHGVTRVAGERYTMPIWFTKDSTHMEV